MTTDDKQIPEERAKDKMSKFGYRYGQIIIGGAQMGKVAIAAHLAATESGRYHHVISDIAPDNVVRFTGPFEPTNFNWETIEKKLLKGVPNHKRAANRRRKRRRMK